MVSALPVIKVMTFNSHKAFNSQLCDFSINIRKRGHAILDESCQRMNNQIMIAERLELKTAPLRT